MPIFYRKLKISLFFALIQSSTQLTRITESNSSINLTHSQSEEEILIKNSQAFDFTLKVLAIIILVLGFFILILVNTLVFTFLKRFKCCQNDSFCQFVNNDLGDEEKNSKNIFSIDIHPLNETEYKTLDKRNSSNDSIKTPLYEAKTDSIVDYYGTKLEEPDENSLSINNCGNKYFYNRNNVVLNSFRKENTNIKKKQDRDYLDIYSNFLIINPTENSSTEILDEQLDELEKIEKHLSKSLSELNDLHKKLCLESTSSESDQQDIQTQLDPEISDQSDTAKDSNEIEELKVTDENEEPIEIDFDYEENKNTIL